MTEHELPMIALRAAVERIVGRVDAAQLTRAARDLSDAYRTAPDRPRPGLAMDSDAARIAYLVTRFPATLAALAAAMRQVASRVDIAEARELLELGSGPGPSLWALAPLMPALERARCVDADHRMLAIARELAESAPLPPSAAVDYVTGDLSRPSSLIPADVVVMSYALGELAERDRAAVTDRAWAATRDTLIVVEPGTSAGFERIRAARRHLVEMEAALIAPCPHADSCPVASPDWCHFAARTERTRLHRQLKGGALGYEDEKFSFVAVTRCGGATRAAARIVSRPHLHSGFVRLRLCSRDGLREETVSRRHGPRYRAARHASWGDEWEGE
jgi:ribosomal protein RSM22 (predicted rRNA methylase)